MKWNRFFCGVFALLIVAVITGCAAIRLPEGRYETQNKDEYLLVNNDYIFLHVRAPYGATGPNAYWDWAGPYTIEQDGVVIPDMDKPTRDRWKFYYEFRYENQQFKMHDIGANTVTTFQNEATIRR